MEQLIEQPNSQDMERIATLLAMTSQMAVELGDQALDASLADLPRLQKLTDILMQADGLENQRLGLQAIGMSFGQLLANQNSDYDWWMVDDENGRDPCLRYLETNLLVFPQTLISRRVEDGEAVEVQALYQTITSQLQEQVEKQLDA